MSQRVDYEALPGTRYDQYVPKLRAIAEFVASDEGRLFKPFRDFVRRQGLWDKAKTPTMLSIIDLSWDRQEVRVGALAERIRSAAADDDVRDLLFERLKRDNILLLKYVLEALDVESGGRLHSVHELYRMVTSYVYPGEYVTLPNFQAWVEWLAATGFIKMVGIRWGLSERGLSVIQEFTSLDVEELLEDMEEEEQARTAAAEEASVLAASAPAEDMEDQAKEDILDGVMGVQGASDTGSVQAAPLQDQESIDAPPQPKPRGQRPASPATSLHPQSPVISRVSGPASSAGLGAPAPKASLPVVEQPLVYSPSTVSDSVEIESLVQVLIGWYEQWRGWPSLSAARLGVDTGPEGVEGDALLVELGVLALLVEGLPVQPQLLAAARRIRQSGFFDRLHGEGGFSAALEVLGDVDKEPWLRAASGRLFHAHGIVRRLSDSPGLLEALHEVDGPEEALRLLRGRLFGGASSEAPFWVIRELVRDGIIDGVRFAQATVVPSRRLLRNAARIGLISHADVPSFEGLIQASALVSRYFGAESGYGEALEQMDWGLGLSSLER